MAKKNPHSYTRKLQFSEKEKQKIANRDYGQCIFCNMGIPAEGATWLDLQVKDYMHFIPKSALGLGVERNGAIGCRYHHSILDNGNKGLRRQLLDRFEEYLKSRYPDWDKTKLTYSKWN